MDLNEARERIREVDEEMAALFVRRMEAVEAVAAYKRARGLPIEDLASDVELTTRDGMVIATSPEQSVRPVEWKLAEWQRSVTTFLDPCSHEAMLQLNEWNRGGAYNPAIIDYGFQLLMMSTASASPQLELARCVVRPADGSYQFHASLLSTIPEWEQSLPNPLV